MEIINFPGREEIVKNAVQDINNVRCCNVLPDVDLLWLDSADLEGISNRVPITAQRENACKNFDCTGRCKAKNNGGN